jgi:hypothetical protein
MGNGEEITKLMNQNALLLWKFSLIEDDMSKNFRIL